MPIGLFALALGGFGIGLTEFVIMGLLPDLASDFGVSEAAAGWLISGYALSVVIGALGLTAAVTRLPRKHVLIALMGLFILGNLISALAPTYPVMMLGRIVAALCHGAFFGIGSVLAADMVAPTKKAGAIAIMFTGLTVANVLGVPFGTLLGQNLGWRATFWAITAIGVLALVGIATLVPATAHATAGAGGLRGELRAFRSSQVWLSIAVTVLGYGGMFGAFTYIAFTLTEVSGFAAASVPWLLVLFGVGLFVGNVLGGKAADRSVDRTLIVVLAALAVVLVAFALTAGSQGATIASLVLLGGFGFATVPGLQMRVMSYASEAPTLASGANIAAFNLGNALGALLGGLTISAGLGYTSPIWAGAVVTVAGLAVMLVAAARARRSRPADQASRVISTVTKSWEPAEPA
ncbi:MULTISPECIES: MFS transporter [Cryobacterium]|uniref:MFS transporter n=1 Tax=Cryobacterium glucosi TaxID=1259175 RepID=A0ABY2IQB9_9MICO|nr:MULTISPECIES: MFS transporter [Cryobacterium]MEB0002704.1 MFS transporter [Cryobacterium sp. RTC2.1]MEB0287417.1 MFS transporter [Cryobacterium sp. 10S3]MEB0305672.1 MFS transporter [Cryobacterium sp. 10I1]TFB98269.1 MFS transporter [Cryobacterium sp. MDB2-A-1]TFC06124.1 MFS transporter [Cryobacterium sp. MDB2-33-2]